jgi:hypothetical protein
VNSMSPSTADTTKFLPSEMHSGGVEIAHPKAQLRM